MKDEGSRFGLSPQYNFCLNPYPSERLTRCPFCDRKMGQRKLPLLIHIDPLHLIALNYTCRYCADCDLLIAHKHEIEHLLTVMFHQRDPAAIGNEYLIMGTLEKRAWREGLKNPQPMRESFAHTRRFKAYYQELRMARRGWYPDGEEPPIWEPPPSEQWVKRAE